MVIKYIGLSLLFLLSECVEGMDLSPKLSPKKEDKVKTDGPLLKIINPDLARTEGGREELDNLEKISEVLKKAKSVTLSARSARQQNVPSVEKSLGASLSIQEEQPFDDLFIKEIVTTISQQYHIKPEVLIKYLCARYGFQESKVPCDVFVQQLQSLRQNDKDTYQEMQKFLLERLHELQVVQESNSSGGSEEKIDSPGSTKVTVLPEKFEDLLPLVKNIGKDKHDPLQELFAQMMVEQHDQKIKALESEKQAGRIKLTFAVISTVVAGAQMFGWPLVNLILNLTNHTNTVGS